MLADHHESGGVSGQNWPWTQFNGWKREQKRRNTDETGI